MASPTRYDAKTQAAICPPVPNGTLEESTCAQHELVSASINAKPFSDTFAEYIFGDGWKPWKPKAAPQPIDVMQAKAFPPLTLRRTMPAPLQETCSSGESMSDSELMVACEEMEKNSKHTAKAEPSPRSEETTTGWWPRPASDGTVLFPAKKMLKKNVHAEPPREEEVCRKRSRMEDGLNTASKEENNVIAMRKVEKKPRVIFDTTPKKAMRGETCSSKQIDDEPYETPVKNTMCMPVGGSENHTAGSSSDKLTLTDGQLARIAEKKIEAMRRKTEKLKRDATPVKPAYAFV